MNKKEIIEFLEENGASRIEDLSSKGKQLVIKFYYEFDEDELEAARGYANDESEEEEDGDQWKEEYFLPFLNDIAADNIGEVIEEIIDEFDLNAQYISYDADIDKEERCEFIAVFSKEDFDIEEVLEDLGL